MKQFRLTLVLTVLMSMVGLQAFADWDTSTKVQVDGLYYYLDNDNLQAQVTSMPSGKYTGSITIPSSFNYQSKTYSVTSIGDYVFQDCYGLTSVTIPNSVTGIDDYAFEGCTGLTSVTIPNSVTSIGKFAFLDCPNLASIVVESGNPNYDSRNDCNAIIETASNTLIAGCKNTIIPNSVASIGEAAFYGCSGLTSIDIPNSVTSIGERAFSDCSGLTSIDIPNSVTSIGDEAFDGCSGLTSVTIPNSVTSIGNYAFFGCSALTSVTIPNSVTGIDDYAFEGCSGLTSIIIPNSVTSIGDYAFSDCGLTSVTIPNSVTSIGNRAFEDCPNLTSMVVESGNPNYDSRNDCNAIIETASNTLIAGCKNTIIPNSVASIGEAAFYGCSNLISITIPNSVTSIGDEAFDGCSGLTSVTALNPTPVAITYYVFTNRTNATLYVPKGSKDAYKAAAYWKQFKEIIEIDPTGIDQISLQENGEQGIDEEGAVWYTIDGKQIDKPKKGINIIRMKNGTTKKVVVK